jgi:hypothetical protein
VVALDPTVRILDLDGSVTRQSGLLSDIGPNLRVVDLRTLGPALRYLCPRGAVRELELSLRPEDRGQLTFIGSGDFHHVTASLLRRFSDPITVIVFDTHADFDRRPPIPCCGSWLADAVKLPHVARIVSIGLSAADIGGWRLLLGRVPDLLSGRIGFYPYDCLESRYWGGIMRFQTVSGNEWPELCDDIAGLLPTGNVYISIDKDCLVAEEAFTNWEIGQMRVAQITSFIERLAKTHRIVGADITGEYSPLEIRNPLLRLIAKADHPDKAPVTPDDLRLNEATNRTLLNALRPRALTRIADHD